MDADRQTDGNANIQAGLGMIKACEGTDTPDGYMALFGYTPTNHRVFNNNFACHPNIKLPFTQTDGTQNYSTAAGGYQFIYSTWSRLAARLSLPDFSPASQDAAAIATIKDCGAYDDLAAGNLQVFIDKCSGIWASLPASHYPQPKRTYAFALAAFTAHGGTAI